MVFKKGDIPWNKGNKKIISKEETNARNRESYYKFRSSRREHTNTYNHNVRYEVIKHYSKGMMNCDCCAENIYNFLTIDHINHKNSYKGDHNIKLSGGFLLVNWIRKNNYPEGFRVLCYNCNSGRGKRNMNDVCPHELQRDNSNDWEWEL